MPNFFGPSDDDGGGFSDVEEFSDDGGQGATTQGGQFSLPQSQQFAFDSDSDYEGTKRVVETKDKKMKDAFNAVVDTIRQKLKINDWVAISKEYDELTKQKERWRHVTAQYGVPRSAVRCLVTLGEKIEISFAERKKAKLSPSNFKSLTRMRQRFRKDKLYQDEKADYLAEDSKHEDTETEDEEWSVSGSDYDDDDQDEVDESDDEKDDVESEENDDFDNDGFEDVAALSGGDDFDDDDDYSDDGQEYDDGDSGNESDQPGQGPDEPPRVELPGITARMRNRAFWVIRVTAPKPQKTPTAPQPRRRPDPKPAGEPKPAVVVKSKVEWNEEYIRKKLKKYEQLRGRQHLPPKAKEELELMLQKAATLEIDPKKPRSAEKHELEMAKLRTKIACVLLGFLFDTNLNRTTYLNLKIWHRCVEVMKVLLGILRATPAIRLIESVYTEMVDESEMGEDFDPIPEEKHAPVPQEERKSGGEGQPRGDLYAFIDKLNAEYKKSLQQIEQTDEKYDERVKDLPVLCELVSQVRKYYSSIGEKDKEARLAVLQLSHMYDSYDKENDAYSPDPRVARSRGTLGRHGPVPILASRDDEINQLCEFVYKHGSPRQKTHAVLYRITNYAIHNRFFHARDMLLMSHLNDTISRMDIATRILFNRAQAYIALCAFRYGFFAQCMNICAELYSTGHIKECLAQGVTQRWNERDPKQEAIEKAREFPPHQHISQDLLESVHLISAMFLEVPNIAKNGISTDRRNIHSRNFRLNWDRREKALFASPPENTRDYVMAASKAMFRGDWKECQEHIGALKMWQVTSNSEEVQKLVNQRIREVSLQTYLVTFGCQYKSISLQNLAKMFDLEERNCHRLVSSMLVDHNCPLKGSWDQPSQTISIFSKNPTLLQQQAFGFADKIKVLLDGNKSVLESRGGGGGGGGGGRSFQNDRRTNNDRQNTKPLRNARRGGHSNRFNSDRFTSLATQPTRVGGYN